MNSLLNRKHFFSKHKISIFSVSTVVWLPIPCVLLVQPSESLKYRTFCSYLNCESFTSNFSKKPCFSSNMSETIKSSILRLRDYDCIGFDLDNTLCEYNVGLAVQMEYDVLANFLVKQKGYGDYLLKVLDSNDIDFLQKGLIIDFARGNILKVGENGFIIRASHGTKQLTEEEIIITYGETKEWQVTKEFSKNLLVAWDGPLSEQMRALLDYFDMPASLAFARIIDALGDQLSQIDMSKAWFDVKDGLVNMYKREHFANGKGDYFQKIKSNPQKFIKKCDSQVIQWLRKIKESSVTFVITGSNCDFASLTAETCLGKNWRSLFDIVICYARKPGFFTGCRPFIRLDNCLETDVIDGTGLELGHMYSQGNWQELYQLFARKLNKKQPKCLYFGDNLIQDIYAPSEYTKCDTVAVVEELNVENTATSKINTTKEHKSQTILESVFWGSYLHDNKEQLNTIWGSIIKNNANLCIPSLSVLAKYTLNHELPTFSSGCKRGYFLTGPTKVN